MTASASTTRTAAEAHARLQTHREIQFDLPAATPPEVPQWLRDLLEALGGASNFAGWLFWGLVALGLVWLAWLFFSWAIAQRRQRDAAAEPATAPEWRPEAGVARRLLDEAEAMAAAGRYEEAVRLLLHRSLEDMAKRRPRLLRPALTSREIARIADLPGAARETFAAMAAPVERSLFGGRSLDRGAWEAARDAYRAFALPGAWA